MVSASPEVVVAHMLAAYPPVQPTVVGSLASTRNDNWLIADGTGRRYVLRRHRQHAHTERVGFQLRFQQHLLRGGFPTAEVVQPRAGGLFVLDDDGVPWALFTYIDGDYYDFGNMGQVAEAARRLAQFHALAETFPAECVALEYDPPIRDWWTGCEENLQALEDLYAGRAVADELAYLRDWWRWVLSEWPLTRLDGLPAGWVYSDYHGRNMVFHGDNMCGLFDFDDVNRGPLVYDVARGVHMFGRERRGAHRIRPEVANLFVDEYARYRALSKEEREALSMMVALCYPPQARYHQYCQQRFGEDLVARLRREVAAMRALRAEMARIGPLFTDLVPVGHVEGEEWTR
jgi:Ser/Thr protein kinase RdoA (MazF antagonist)